MAGDYTLEEWRADLAALKDAIGAVSRERDSITETMSSIDTKMDSVATHWNSPSYGTFDEIDTWFTTVQTDLANLLDDIVHRMNTSYTNYRNAEAANFSNVSDGGSNG